MIISAVAPTRISLFGGGCDIDPYASTYGGLVISMAINLRQKCTLYSDEDIFKKRPPANSFPLGANPDFYYTIFKEFPTIDGGHSTKIACEFDGLIESGIGSSASAAVCLIGAISKRLNLNMSPAEIAEKAWDIEVNKLGLFGGKQDQYTAALGGVNFMEFSRYGVKVTPLAKGFIEPLLPSLVLFYTGKNRKSATIQEGFKKLSSEQIQTLNQIKQLTIKAIDPIGKGDIEEVGHLLDRSWRLKKRSNKGVTEPWIDKLYEKAKKHGSLGGKIMGAGGGGFLFFVIKPNKKEEFIKEMTVNGLEHWDFSPCWTGLDVRILPT